MSDEHPPPSAPPAGTGGPASGAGAAQPSTSAQPPPLTAFAWSSRLVRPVEGRLLAGVCGALGRGTNTDPVLWRVLIAVLSIFGGIGVLIYLLGWLLLPADGDTATPVEAMIGRGESQTSPTMTVIGVVVVVLSLGVFFSEPFRPGPWGIILLGGAVLLLLRDRRGQARSAPTGAGSAAGADSGASQPPPPTSAFAPRGPFGPPPPGDEPAGFSGLAPPLAPPPNLTPPPRAPAWSGPPPVAPPPRSRLGRLTFSIALLVLGALGILDLTGFSVPAAGYVAAALTTVGLGTIVGTWFGRARGLIPLGIVLSLLLGLIGVFAAADNRWWQGGVGELTWAPDSLAQMQDSYRHGIGEARLDLTQVDFATATGPVHVDVRLHVGNLEIIAPPGVDVTVLAQIEGGGNADVFGRSWNGLGLDPRTVTDLDRDGPGGGDLRIDATITMGNLEVRR